jgi:hypothetical protein
MHFDLSWLKVEERLTASLLVFVGDIDVLKVRTLIGTTHASLHSLQVQNRGWEIQY